METLAKCSLFGLLGALFTNFLGGLLSILSPGQPSDYSLNVLIFGFIGVIAAILSLKKALKEEVKADN